MKKFKLVKILALIAVLVLGFGLAACDDLPVVYASEEDCNNSEYHPLQLIMNAGEKQSINTGHFKGLSIDFANIEKFNLGILYESSEKVVTIKDNAITAVNNGYAEVYAVIRERVPAEASNNGRAFIRVWEPNIAHIYVINEAAMTPITTAQQLAGMKNDLNGKYVLKADIDLKDWGEWTPIGKDGFYINNQPPETMFTGMFVNPYDYKIKNLTITTSETTEEAGLFGCIGERALVSGIILEDVFIDLSDYVWEGSGIPIGTPKVGGIAGSSNRMAEIFNCSVSGMLIGGGNDTGGIVGLNTNSYIFGCTFRGKIEGPSTYPDYYAGAGGIAGKHFSVDDGDIDNCYVYADINGKAVYAGGIIGFNAYVGIMTNCFFTGTLAGTKTGEMIGYDDWRMI